MDGLLNKINIFLKHIENKDEWPNKLLAEYRNEERNFDKR
jgi:hypothetical protein